MKPLEMVANDIQRMMEEDEREVMQRYLDEQKKLAWPNDMTDAEKVEAFNLIARSLTNKWHDGRWSWWCRTPTGGPTRDTREEAVSDLIEWAKQPRNQK